MHSNTGEMKKQKLVINGKNENSRCFEKMKLLETNYDFNKIAW